MIDNAMQYVWLAYGVGGILCFLLIVGAFFFYKNAQRKYRTDIDNNV